MRKIALIAAMIAALLAWGTVMLWPLWAGWEAAAAEVLSSGLRSPAR